MSSLPPSDDPESALRRSIRTPDRRVRVFVSSTLEELAPERAAAREAITLLRLTPVMFELGARPHPPRNLYQAYLQQSDIFVGIYWQRYGWVTPGMIISGLEDEYRLSGDKPRLIYIRTPAPDREPRLQELIQGIEADDTVSYKPFSEPEELRDLLADDLAILLTERFEVHRRPHSLMPATPRANALLPTGTITFLFTDIEGSTVLWEQDPDAMHVALARHDALLRHAIESSGGSIVKTTGDGVFAVFGTAADALAACLAGQRALQTPDANAGRPAPAVSEARPPIAIKVRMGLHTGVAELRNGDYFGPSLNRAARIMSAAHGEQVLLSSATAELLRKQLPEGVILREMGEHRLKGLLNSEHLLQVVAPDLRSDFPPLTSLTGHRTGSCPVFRSGMVGREKELAAAREMLLRPDTGLLTMIGTGGTGKTRLGVHLATEVQQNFKDGVRFVALAAVPGPDLVLSAIAGALGVMETGNTPLLESLTGSLVGKQLLLVLDNFEHLTAAAPAVAALLEACPGVKVLATSRRPLRVRGEKEFPVPPLDLPGPGQPSDLRQLSQCAAVQLFVERARDVRPGFELTEENAPAVGEICRRLDGLPLAIELAAARVKVLTPRAMLRRLSSGLALLTGGARDLPARQQTLSNTIEWSYDLLQGPEQQLFRRLAAFAGGFTFEACESVCNADGNLGIDTFDGIASLAENSLVSQDEGRGVEPRYTLLRTIRDYVSERLAASGEEPGTRRGHALYYRDLAVQAEPGLLTAQQEVWMRRLEEEHDNLRAALEWCMGQDDSESGILALSIAGSLWRFWWTHGHLSEGRRWLQRALEVADRTTGSGAGEPRIEALKAKALKGLGNLALGQTDYLAARSLYEEALAINRNLNDEKEVSALLNNLGNVNADMGRPDEARHALEESLALARRRGYAAQAAAALANLGGVALDQGDYEQTRVYVEEALGLQRKAGQKSGMAHSLTNLGAASTELGEYGRAHLELAEAMQLSRELGADLSIAFIFEALGVLACDEEDNEKARSLHLQALAIRLALGHKSGVVECLRSLAEVAVATEKLERAARLYGAAEALREEVGSSFFHSTRKRYERATAAGRARMGEAAWEEATRAGSGLTLEQAVAFARGEILGTAAPAAENRAGADPRPS